MFACCYDLRIGRTALMFAVLAGAGGPVAAACAHEGPSPGSAVATQTAAREPDKVPERVAPSGSAIFNPFAPAGSETAAVGTPVEAKPDASLSLALAAGGAVLIAWLLARLSD